MPPTVLKSIAVPSWCSECPGRAEDAERLRRTGLAYPAIEGEDLSLVRPIGRLDGKMGPGRTCGLDHGRQVLPRDGADEVRAVQADLVDTSQAGLNGSYYIRAIALEDLRAMFEAATSAGAQLAVQSAYRSYQGQVLTFNGWVRQVGYARRSATSARPGHSEHQLGTAIDFGRSVERTVDAMPTGQPRTEGAWLQPTRGGLAG